MYTQLQVHVHVKTTEIILNIHVLLYIYNEIDIRGTIPMYMHFYCICIYSTCGFIYSIRGQQHFLLYTCACACNSFFRINLLLFHFLVDGAPPLALCRFLYSQRGARVSCAALHKPTGLLATGFTNGVFTLHEMPDFTPIHTLRYFLLPW